MCSPCCDLCYQKYIHKDGTVDENEVQKLIGENASLHDGMIIEDYPKRPYRLCTCPCHQHGMMVLH